MFVSPPSTGVWCRNTDEFRTNDEWLRQRKRHKIITRCLKGFFPRLTHTNEMQVTLKSRETQYKTCSKRKRQQFIQDTELENYLRIAEGTGILHACVIQCKPSVSDREAQLLYVSQAVYVYHGFQRHLRDFLKLRSSNELCA